MHLNAASDDNAFRSGGTQPKVEPCGVFGELAPVVEKGFKHVGADLYKSFMFHIPLVFH